MRFMLISDNHDTAVGMRLAGITGVIASDARETEAALDAAIADEDVGIVLITRRIGELCSERINDIKLHRSRPLIVEVPDRHIGENDEQIDITRYVREAIGINI